jgi:hypothetical protein
MCRLLENLNPREFEQYLKENYKYFNVYCGHECIGTAKCIFGYYAYVEELDEKRRIIDFADTSNKGAILYVEQKSNSN